MKNLQQGFTHGTELEFGLQMAGNENWHVAYNYPMTGVGIHYNYMNNPDVLGYALGFYGFLEVPIVRQPEFEIMYRLTSGLTYVSERFNQYDNPENAAISTWVNYLFNTGFQGRYWMTKETAFGMGFGLTHYSNGGTRIPNKGLNQLHLNLGVLHYLKGEYNEFSGVKRPIVWKPNHEIYAMGAMGRVDIGTLVQNVGTNQMFTTAVITLGYNYRYASHRKIGLSLDGFYNESFNYSYWDNGFVYHEYEWTDLSRLGMAINHEFVLKRLRFIIAGGVYLIPSPDKVGVLGLKTDEWAYERLGLRYYPIENFFINVTVKAYGFNAETIEAGIGFSFQSK
ncbi:MAG: acyloxyacyl hydrolase [Bacteroidota bacterium]|nr:acyloxyacyl hydrolase [Bacteroidota bacterium]